VITLDESFTLVRIVGEVKLSDPLGSDVQERFTFGCRYALLARYVPTRLTGWRRTTAMPTTADILLPYWIYVHFLGYREWNTPFHTPIVPVTLEAKFSESCTKEASKVRRYFRILNERCVLYDFDSCLIEFLLDLRVGCLYPLCRWIFSGGKVGKYAALAIAGIQSGARNFDSHPSHSLTSRFAIGGI